MRVKVVLFLPLSATVTYLYGHAAPLALSLPAHLRWEALHGLSALLARFHQMQGHALPPIPCNISTPWETGARTYIFSRVMFLKNEKYERDTRDADAYTATYIAELSRG